MKELTYKYNYIRIAPRKIRLIIDMIRKMSLNEAIVQTNFLQKNASKPVNELLKSAYSSIKEQDFEEIDKYFIKNIICNEGPTLKRRILRSKGRAASIKKRTSHIKLIVAKEESKKNKIKKNINKDK